MGDFDFDELDKAVNNVLGPNEKKDSTPTDGSTSNVSKEPANVSQVKSSVNRVAPASSRPVIDIMAPSKRHSREGSLVAPSPRSRSGSLHAIDRHSHPEPTHLTHPVPPAHETPDTSVTLRPSTPAEAHEAMASEPRHEPTLAELEAKYRTASADEAEKSTGSVAGQSAPRQVPDETLESDDIIAPATDVPPRQDARASETFMASADESSPSEAASKDALDIDDAAQSIQPALTASDAKPDAPNAMRLEDRPAGEVSTDLDLNAVKNELEKSTIPQSEPEPETSEANSDAPKAVNASEGAEKDSVAEPSATGPEPTPSPFLSDAKVEKRPLGGVTVPAEGPKLDGAAEPATPSAHVVSGGQPHSTFKPVADIEAPQLDIKAAVDAAAEGQRPVFDTEEYHTPPSPGGSPMQKFGGNGLLYGAIGLLVVAVIIAVIVFFFPF